MLLYFTIRKKIKSWLITNQPFVWRFLKLAKKIYTNKILSYHFDSPVIKVIRKYKLKINGVIQVGGHHGEEIKPLVNFGIKKISIFEPIKYNLEILEAVVKSYKEKNKLIIIHPVALGSKQQKIKIHVADNWGASSSILKPKKHLEYYKDITFKNSEEINMSTLDVMIDVKDNANFLMMDVQGYELEVLKGGDKTLRKIDYIYSEITREELYEGNVMVNELDEFLFAYNFLRIYTEWWGDGYDGNALYVKKNLLRKYLGVVYYWYTIKKIFKSYHYKSLHRGK